MMKKFREKFKTLIIKRKKLAILLPIFVTIALLGSLAPSNIITVDTSGRITSVMGITVTPEGYLSVQSDVALAVQIDTSQQIAGTRSYDLRDSDVVWSGIPERKEIRLVDNIDSWSLPIEPFGTTIPKVIDSNTPVTYSAEGKFLSFTPSGFKEDKELEDLKEPALSISEKDADDKVKYEDVWGDGLSLDIEVSQCHWKKIVRIESLESLGVIPEDSKFIEITSEKSDDELSGKKLKQVAQSTSELAEQWTNRNHVMLIGGVMLLDEFKRYFHNRRPHNPYGVLLGHIINVWRHLDLLMVGMTQLKREIDAISCLPHVTHHVKCSWNGLYDMSECRIFRVRYVGTKGVIEITGKPMKVLLDGKKPRPQLGGYRYYDLYPSKNLHNLTPTTGGIRI